LPQHKAAEIMFDGKKVPCAMHRALASFLAVLFSFPLITPFLAASMRSDLPACCRRDGKHHCALSEMDFVPDSPGGVGLTAVRPTCPLYPQAVLLPAFSKDFAVASLPLVDAPRPLRFLSGDPDSDQPDRLISGIAHERAPPSSLS
jgi:hypothetical protein